MDDTDFKILCGLILSLMICFGVIGNITSFLTWRNGKRCKQYPGAIYLSGLAVSDTLVLCTSGIKYVIELLFGVNLWNLNETFCRLLHTTWHFFFLVSTWIVVTVTVERTVAVCQPLKSAVWTSKKREVIVTIIYIVVFLLINLPFTVGAKMMPNIEAHNNVTSVALITDNSVGVQRQNLTTVTQEKTCQADPSSFYFKYENQYHNWFIDFTLLFSVPLIILTACNIVIVVTLYRQKNSPTGPESQHHGKSGTSGAMTARVVALSIVQCISVGPYSIVALIPGVIPETQAVDTLKYIDWVFIILALIWYLNNSVNFILYSLFGRAFRLDCVDMFCGRQPRRMAYTTSEFRSVLSSDL